MDPVLAPMKRRTLFKRGAFAGLAATVFQPMMTLANEVPDGGAAHAEAADAVEALQGALNKLEAQFLTPEFALRTPQDFAEARRVMLHVLMHALHAWLEADPARPFFVSYIDKHKKMLGDNPDARYYTAVISDEHSYRIRGNLAGATYTSFTIEMSDNAEGNRGVGSAINDSQFEVDENGDFEIVVSREQAEGNWLELNEGAASITTRHYFEREVSVNNDALTHVPLSIENLVQQPPRPAPNDADIAAGIRRVISFLEANVISFGAASDLPWVSTTPNVFNPIVIDNSNAAVNYAAVDNVYAMAPFVLQPDQALVIRGRFPKCRFCNLVLFNRFLQTFDYETRRVSLNRAQAVLEEDGSFKIILAARDPGHPNWLDTEGRAYGLMFWRFQLPEEDIAALQTEVITLT